MREALKKAEVKKLLGVYANELAIVEKMVGNNSPISMCHPETGETIWVSRRGAVYYYERHLEG